MTSHVCDVVSGGGGRERCRKADTALAMVEMTLWKAYDEAPSLVSASAPFMLSRSCKTQPASKKDRAEAILRPLEVSCRFFSTFHK